MERFAEGEVDVLLSTTIIESGLDFPNANTLIVEHADMFGMAQLYQLRGRVGRGTRRGYAYLFHSRRVNEEGRFRLEALQETGTIGGGFAIALRDLELRGAGELLGARQSGHIAAVGFKLYTQMLTSTVARLKAQRAGEPGPPEPVGSITIELPLPVGLPADYVPDDKLRLQLYRRLAELTSRGEIRELEAELKDRFGPLSERAQNLLLQLELKVLARDALVPAIVVESGQIALKPPWLRQLEPEALAELRGTLGERARAGRREIWLPLSLDREGWARNLREVLQLLVDWWRRREGTTAPPASVQ
jgi:transcription-repair coupling factor (superfamily II helicase)